MNMMAPISSIEESTGGSSSDAADIPASRERMSGLRIPSVREWYEIAIRNESKYIVQQGHTPAVQTNASTPEPSTALHRSSSTGLNKLRTSRQSLLNQERLSGCSVQKDRKFIHLSCVRNANRRSLRELRIGPSYFEATSIDGNWKEERSFEIVIVLLPLKGGRTHECQAENIEH